MPQYKRVLFVSPRRTFSRFLCKDFGASCYLDWTAENNVFENDILVISMEGLHKLVNVEKYDLIVYDECEDNLSVFSSTTLRKKQVQTYNVFTDLIKHSKKIIMAGSFITDKTLNFGRSLIKSMVLIKNSSPPTKRLAREVSNQLYNSMLIDSMKKDEKNYGVWSSLKAMNSFVSELKGAAGENPKLQKIYDNMLIYNSEVDDDVFETLDEIESTWSDASFVGTSPSITVGNSYAVKDNFHNVFISLLDNGILKYSLKKSYWNPMCVYSTIYFLFFIFIREILVTFTFRQ